MAILSLVNLSVGYGKIQVIRDLSIEVPQGRIVTLLGANGSGKTTTMRAVMGFLRPYQGSIRYKGRDISAMSPDRRVFLGISMVDERRQLFPDMTVKDTLELGAYSRKDKRNVRSDIDQMFKLFPILELCKNRHSRTLSGGQQQMLAISRALMARPEMILLDEPSLGLAPLVIVEVFKVIKKISDTGVTILLSEQNARIACLLAEYNYILENGHIVFQGSTHELLFEDHLRNSYLGGKL